MVLKKIVLFFIACFIFQYLHPQNNEDDLLGRWYTQKKESIVELYKKDGKINGKLVWVKEPYDNDGKLKTDIKNPDLTLRNRPYTGMEFIFGFKFNGKDTWSDGTIYNAQDGRTYSAYFRLDGIDTIKLRGYIGFEWLGKTTTWYRVKN